MATTDAQKQIPLAEHTRVSMQQEPAAYGTTKWRATCSCGWRGRLSTSMDEAGGQFAGHTSKVWEAQRTPTERTTMTTPTPPTKPKTSEAEAILDWLERNHTLHRAVEALYVVDGYEVDITYEGERHAGPWHGETLREAYLEAMKHWDKTHGGVDLLASAPAAA